MRAKHEGACKYHGMDSMVFELHSDVLHINDKIINFSLFSESSSLPTLATEVVLDRVWTEFYMRESHATLHWILEWITARQSTRTVDTIGACPEELSEQTSKMGLLFEKNSLNSYQEKEIISEAALKTLKNHKREISEPGSDIIDDVTKKAIEELEKITHGSDESIPGLFSRIYFSVLGLTAAEIIRTALLKNNSTKDFIAAESQNDNSSSRSPGLTTSKIPPQGNTTTDEELQTNMEKLCSWLHMSKKLENMIAQPLLRNAISNI